MHAHGAVPVAALRALLPAVFLALPSAILALPGSVAAQVIPGGHTPRREQERARYVANVLAGVAPVRLAWMNAVARDSLDAVMALYTDDAVVTPPDGEMRMGREAIRAFWEGFMPGIGAAEIGMADMDASGRMAMIVGPYTLDSVADTGEVTRESGSLLTLYVQEDRGWAIRAQVFSRQAP
jgi:uncharacterized protein (TIGR02246 family)